MELPVLRKDSGPSGDLGAYETITKFLTNEQNWNYIPQVVLACGIAVLLYPLPFGISSSIILLIALSVAFFALVVALERPASDVTHQALTKGSLLSPANAKAIPKMGTDILEGKRSLYSDILKIGLHDLNYGFVGKMAVFGTAHMFAYYLTLVFLIGLVNLCVRPNVGVDLLGSVPTSGFISLIGAFILALTVGFILTSIAKGVSQIGPSFVAYSLLQNYGKATNPISRLVIIKAFTSPTKAVSGFFAIANFKGFIQSEIDEGRLKANLQSQLDSILGALDEQPFIPMENVSIQNMIPVLAGESISPQFPFGVFRGARTKGIVLVLGVRGCANEPATETTKQRNAFFLTAMGESQFIATMNFNLQLHGGEISPGLRPCGP